MKKITLSVCLSFLSALCCAIPAFAAPRSPQQAVQAAMEIRDAAPGVNKAPGAISPSVAYTAQDAYYVVNYGGNNGFAVISADDRVEMVLGYSFQGNFDYDKAPCNVKWWLDQYKLQIDAYLASNPSRMANAKISDEGFTQPSTQTSSMRKAPKKEILPLIKTTWNQLEPYWNDCVIDGEQCVTGCVATAMAQVMNYHQWPQGPGTGERNGIDFSQITFDWDNMRDGYSGSYTAAQAAAVAELMRACGAAVDMNYSPDESGANGKCAARALMENFDYSKGIRFYIRDHFNNQEWIDMIYAELAAGRPILYNGNVPSGAGGHAFVLDGYLPNENGNDSFSDDFVHINWGWEGAYDGYFYIWDLNPSGQGTGGFDGGYNKYQRMAVGIEPFPASGTSDADMQPVDIIFWDTPQFGTMEAGYLDCFLTNFEIAGFNTIDAIYLGLKFNNVESGEENGLFLVALGALDPYGIWNWNNGVNIPIDFEDGIYEIKVIWTRESGDDNFEATVPKDGLPNYLIVEDGAWRVSNYTVDVYPNILISSVDLPENTKNTGFMADINIVDLEENTNIYDAQCFINFDNGFSRVCNFNVLNRTNNLNFTPFIHLIPTSGSFYFSSDEKGENKISDDYEYSLVDDDNEYFNYDYGVQIADVSTDYNSGMVSVRLRVYNNSTEDKEFMYGFLWKNRDGNLSLGDDAHLHVADIVAGGYDDADFSFIYRYINYNPGNLELMVGEVVYNATTDSYQLRSTSQFFDAITLYNLGLEGIANDFSSKPINMEEAELTLVQNNTTNDYTEVGVPTDIPVRYWDEDAYDVINSTARVARLSAGNLRDLQPQWVSFMGDTKLNAGDLYYDGFEKLQLESDTPNEISLLAWEGGKDANIDVEFPKGLLNKYMHFSNWAEMVRRPAYTLDLSDEIHAAEQNLERNDENKIHAPYYTEFGDILSLNLPELSETHVAYTEGEDGVELLYFLKEANENHLIPEGEVVNFAAKPVVEVMEFSVDPSVENAKDTDEPKQLSCALKLKDTEVNSDLYNVEWKSSDEAIASVDENGVVTIHKAGLCSITATVKEAPELTAACELDIATGIDRVTDDQLAGDVYGVNGMLVLRGANAQQVRSLQPGIYVINGLKISVK